MSKKKLSERKGDKGIPGGVLYIVAMPIGNPEDITLRGLKILGQVDRIAAEDTRNTRRFLARHNIKSRLISFHEHNEHKRVNEILKKLKDGESIALVSDAGTPSVSDPGYRLVKGAIGEGVKVVPVPGVSAPIAALSVSGLPSDSFTFAGFLPKTRGKRIARLAQLADETGTIIFYDSPKRVLRLVGEIIEEMGDREGVLCREMTKPYEEFIRGNLSEIQAELKSRSQVKGECTLLVSGGREKKSARLETVRNEIIEGLKNKDAKPSLLAKEIAKKNSLTKKSVYEELLKLQGGV